MSTTTPNLGLYVPASGDGSSNGLPWGVQMQANFEKIDGISGTGTGKGAEMVGYLAPYTGAVARTQASKDADSIHVNDFGGDINLAIAAMSDGMTLYLGNASYGPLSGNLTKGIRIIGAKCPTANAGKTGLEKGSIIKGPFIYLTNNLYMENVGIDSGLDVCNAIYGGTAQEGLACTVAYGTGVYSGNTFINCCAIAKNSAALFHTFAGEMQTRLTVRGLTTWYGTHGAVFKCTKSNVSGVTCILAGDNGFYLKRDEWSDCNTSNFSNIVVDCQGVTAKGVNIESVRGDSAVTPGNLYQINIDNVVVLNPASTGVLIHGATTNTDTVSDCNLSNFIVWGASVSGTVGFYYAGRNTRVSVLNSKVSGCQLAGFLNTDQLTLDATIMGCDAAACNVGFQMRGGGIKLSGNHADNCTTYGYYLLNASSTVFRSNNTARSNGTDWATDGTIQWMELGATLKTSLNAPTFTNSWVNQGFPWADVKYYKGSDGHVYLTGAMKNGTLNAAAFTLPAAFRPALGKRFVLAGLNGGVLTPCDFYVASDGTCTVVAGTNAFCPLDGIFWLSQDADPL